MKKLTLLLSVFTAVFSVSCVQVTKTWEEPFTKIEEDIVYHNKKYMKSKAMYVPHGVDETRMGKWMKFNFAIERGNKEINEAGMPSKLNPDYLDTTDWGNFTREYAHTIQRTKCFAIGQMTEVLADGKARELTFNGLTNTDELDPSTMSPVQGLLHITPMLNHSSAVSHISFFRGGNYLRTTTSNIKVICDPLFAKNNEPIDEFASFEVQAKGVFYSKEDEYGKPVSGVQFDPTNLHTLHVMLIRASLVKVLNELYKTFPVGGPIVNFDPNDRVAVIRASRAEGAQPEMEFVIYARKRSDGADAVRVPLFNATMVTLGGTGTSTLEIWRENTSSKTAKAIINKIYTDFKSAKDEYDFFGCSDGLAQWPEGLSRSFTED